MSRAPGTVGDNMQQEPTYTVGELATVVGNAIDRAFPDEIWVQGEIRDLSRPPSGHVYFSLVDPGDDPTAVAPAMLPVTLFASDKVGINRVLQRSGAGRFADGIAVRIRGRLSHYEARGTVQLRMLWIDTDFTLGKLAAERARVLEAIADDGLLERNRQLPFPLVPLRIGLVTSAGSAAHADFMEELSGSGIAFAVEIFDTRVQGVDAELSLIAALEAAGRSQVVAIVRGGGSRTDLAAFDRESVARAVAACPVPVIVGIGHEIDESVVDRVAARSYRTPTACAAALVAEVAGVLRRLDGAAGMITAAAKRRLTRADRDLEFSGARVGRSARRKLRASSERVDVLSRRIPQGSLRRLGRIDADVASICRRIAGVAEARVDAASALLVWSTTRLGGAARVLERADANLRTVSATLEGRDPAKVLARGWTLTTDGAGRIVRDPHGLNLGDRLTTVFAAGSVGSTVDELALDGVFTSSRPATDEREHDVTLEKESP